MIWQDVFSAEPDHELVTLPSNNYVKPIKMKNERSGLQKVSVFLCEFRSFFL